MPCVFLTETAAVVCTSDLKSGILFTRRDLVDLLQKRFEDLKKIATPLTISFSSVLNVHLKNLPMFLTETSHNYGLSAEPCLLPFLTGDMLERYVVKDLPNRQSLILMLKKYLDSVSSSNLHNYFSKEGVLSFMETGLLTAFYDFSHSLKECSMICSQEETADFLQNIILQYSRRMTSATKITRQAGTSF